MKRQSHTAYAVAYARIRADLMLTEGPKIAEARRRRAQARPVETAPSKQERHRASSRQYQQMGGT